MLCMLLYEESAAAGLEVFPPLVSQTFFLVLAFPGKAQSDLVLGGDASGHMTSWRVIQCGGVVFLSRPERPSRRYKAGGSAGERHTSWWSTWFWSGWSWGPLQLRRSVRLTLTPSSDQQLRREKHDFAWTFIIYMYMYVCMETGENSKTRENLQILSAFFLIFHFWFWFFGSVHFNPTQIQLYMGQHLGHIPALLHSVVPQHHTAHTLL